MSDPDPGTAPERAGTPGPDVSSGGQPAPHPDQGPEPGRVRWVLRLAYDGAPFRGFAAQDGQVTVAGALAEALGRQVRAPVTLVCAGRTDAGVHALDQVVHVDLPEDAAGSLDPVALVRSCNRQLAPAVAVRSAAPAPEGFDARRSATARRYRYLVLNAPVPDPLLAPRAWHVADPLDLRTMAAAADVLVGEHDFRAFCRRPPGTGPGDPIVRRVVDATWATAGGVLAPATGTLYAFEIEANAFCHQMVRSIVGTLVEVGRGRRRPADVVVTLRSADRGSAAQPAPPHGLALVAVRYGDLPTGEPPR